jgi:hypothetical protein
MFAWYQLDFSAIPVSISTVFKMYRKGEDMIHLAAFVFVSFCFGEKFPTAEF